MAGAVDVIAAIAGLCGKNNAADDEDEWNCDFNRRKCLAHVSRDRPATIKKDLAPAFILSLPW
jgi:hypothetical protein